MSRLKYENVVIEPEKEYNKMVKAKRNAEYLVMLNKSFQQLEEGEALSFSMEQLRGMEFNTGAIIIRKK